MLYLRTGLPGAGKTLNAIREIDQEHQPDPNDPTKRLHKDPDHPDLPPRTIYYYGIPDLKADKLKSKWVEFETPEQWFNQPDGSVIVIDEAQRIFGNDGTRARPEKVTRFETHRHQGLDIHLITQHPSLLSSPVRKLVGKHINFIRPYGREKGIFRHEYEFCIDSPEKRANFKQAQEEKVSLDPAYFGTYKSSTVHTHKPVKPSYLKKIPLYAAGVLLPVCLLVGVGYWITSDARSEQDQLRSETDPDTSQVLPTQQTKGIGSALSAKPAEPKHDDYIEQRIPRVEAVASSAPRYDDLTKPRDFPRMICAASTDPDLIQRNKKRGHPVGFDDRGAPFVCTCYTQQVTRVATTPEFCLDAVNNGVFDDTKLMPQIASGRNTSGTMSYSASEPVAIQRGRAATSPPAVYTPQPVNVVADSEYPSRPWR